MSISPVGAKPNRLMKSYHGRSQNMRHLYPGIGLKLWVFRFFQRSKSLWFVRCVCILQSEHEDKHAWNTTWCAKIMDVFCLRLFPRVWSAKPKYPQFELHGWRRHYTVQYSSFGIFLVYIWESYRHNHFCFSADLPCYVGSKRIGNLRQHVFTFSKIMSKNIIGRVLLRTAGLKFDRKI